MASPDGGDADKAKGGDSSTPAIPYKAFHSSLLQKATTTFVSRFVVVTVTPSEFSEIGYG